MQLGTRDPSIFPTNNQEVWTLSGLGYIPRLRPASERPKALHPDWKEIDLLTQKISTAFFLSNNPA